VNGIVIRMRRALAGWIFVLVAAFGALESWASGQAAAAPATEAARVATQAAGPAADGQVVIEVHAGQTIGTNAPIWNFFGADEPNYTYARNGEKLLGELGKLTIWPVYFRTHNLFTTGDGEGSLKWGSTNVYRERADGTPVYNFTITDRIFDALIAAHVIPLVEIGFMPEALSTHPEPYRHTFPNGDIFTGWTYPPKDEAKWSKLVSAYADHLRKRYGAQTDLWLWEVWNEPDIAYWHGTPEEYDRLYDLSAAAIRSILPHARIGGPESTGISDKSEVFLRQFLEHCAHGVNAATGGTGAPLDFISYHPKGSPKFVNGHVVMSVGHQLQAVERGMKVIASYPEWKKTPIILGEFDPEGCAACKGNQSAYRNGPLYGVSVAEATMRTIELARKYDVTLEGAVTWAFEFEDQPAFAGFRELATNGIDKPVLNVFRMMGMLGEVGKDNLGGWLATESSGALPLDDVVEHSVTGAPDINAVAARNGNEIDVLVWNYHDADVAAPPAEIELEIDGLKPGWGIASEFRVDETHSNGYRAWQQMGSPAHPTAQQVAALQKAAGLEETVKGHEIAVRDGKARVNLTLPRQGVALVRIREK
jgi:xylan 1,4-beta-xylosidase